MFFWRVGNSLIDKITRAIELFDFFAERHPISAFFLPFYAMMPMFTLHMTVFSIPLFSGEVSSLFFLVLAPMNLICFALIVRASRFMPRSITLFEIDTESMPKVDDKIKKEILQSAETFARLTLQHPNFTLFTLLLWTFPFGPIVLDAILFGGLKQTNVVMIAFAVCMLASVIFSYIAFFKALGLIIYSEGGMHAISDKSGS